MTIPTPERESFVAVAGGELHVWEWGAPGRPVVVCVHGDHDHGRVWDDLAPRIAALGYHVLAPDRRGHGGSTGVPSGDTWAIDGLDLARLAHAYRSVGLIGHSYGGSNALFTASVWPERVGWVVDIDGLGPDRDATLGVDLASTATRAVATVERHHAEGPRRFTLAELVELRARANPRIPRIWIEHLVELGTVQTPGGRVRNADPVLDAAFPGDHALAVLAAEHARVECSVLLVTGDVDERGVGPGAVGRLRRRVNDLRHHVVSGTGHYPHLERPDEVADVVTAFMGDHR